MMKYIHIASQDNFYSNKKGNKALQEAQFLFPGSPRTYRIIDIVGAADTTAGIIKTRKHRNMKVSVIAASLCFTLALPLASANNGEPHDGHHEKQHQQKYHDKHHDKRFSKRTRAEAFGLQLLEDVNPDPHIVEINLEAREDYVEMIQGIPHPRFTLTTALYRGR